MKEDPYPSPLWEKRRKALAVCFGLLFLILYLSPLGPGSPHFFSVGMLLNFLFYVVWFAVWKWTHPQYPASKFWWPISSFVFGLSGCILGIYSAFLGSRVLAEATSGYLERGDLRGILAFGFLCVLLGPLVMMGGWLLILVWMRFIKRLLGEEYALEILSSPLINMKSTGYTEWLLKNAGYKATKIE